MKNAKLRKIIKSACLSLLIVVSTGSYILKAQNQSITPKLEGTGWQAYQSSETYSAMLGETLSREFFPLFEKQGKISCRVIVRAASRIKNEQYYDPITKRTKYRQVLIPSRMVAVENRVGTYKQSGSSVRIDLSAYEIEATIQGELMEGELTLKLESNQKIRWIAKKFAGENNNSSQSTENSINPASKTDNPLEAKKSFSLKEYMSKEYFWEAADLSSQKKYTEAIEKYTMAINLDKNFGNAYVQRGTDKFELKDYRGAITDYDQGLLIMESSIPIWIEIFKKGKPSRPAGPVSIEEFEEGKISDEVDVYNMALRSLINCLVAYEQRGIAKNLLGDKDGACEDFRKDCELSKKAFNVSNCEKVCSNKSTQSQIPSNTNSSLTNLKLGIYMIKATQSWSSYGVPQEEKITLKLRIESNDRNGEVKAYLSLGLQKGQLKGRVNEKGMLELKGLLTWSETIGISKFTLESRFTLKATVEDSKLINGTYLYD